MNAWVSGETGQCFSFSFSHTLGNKKTVNIGKGVFLKRVVYSGVGTLIKVFQMFKANLPHTCAKARKQQSYCMHCVGTHQYSPNTDATIWQEACFV